MNIDLINQNLRGYNITVSEIIDNNKASETYVRTKFVQDDGYKWETVVPFIIRRSGLFIKDEKELADYLISIKPYFQKNAMNAWRKKEKAKWLKNRAEVTKEFFFVLLSFEEETEFPPNDNPARRIQDIKEAVIQLLLFLIRLEEKQVEYYCLFLLTLKWAMRLSRPSLKRE